MVVERPPTCGRGLRLKQAAPAPPFHEGSAGRASATRTFLSHAGGDAARASIHQRADQRIWPRSSSLTVTSSPLLSSSTRAQPFSIPAEPRSRPPTSLMRPDACTSPSTKTEAPTSYRCSALNAISFPCVLRPWPQRMTLPCRFRLDVRDAARPSKQQWATRLVLLPIALSDTSGFAGESARRRPPEADVGPCRPGEQHQSPVQRQSDGEDDAPAVVHQIDGAKATERPADNP